jgi:hypothetical protein
MQYALKIIFFCSFVAGTIFANPNNPYWEHLVKVKKAQANYGYLLEHGGDALLARIHLI